MAKNAKHGNCPLCKRDVHLTFHHLIPRKVHRRAHFKKHFDKTSLNLGIDICRQCHSGIHKAYDEMALAKTFNTIEKLRTDEVLSRHFDWVSKQKVRT